MYAGAWRQWERWCRGRGLDALPAAPEALAAFSPSGPRPDSPSGPSMATAPASRIGTIRSAPPGGPVRPDRGRRRTTRATRTAPEPGPRAPPASPPAHRLRARPDRVQHRHRSRDRHPRPRRHPARLRLRDETRRTLGPRRRDIITKPTGILISVRRSKTDQDGHGPLVGVARGDNRLTDPIRALDAWLRIRPQSSQQARPAARHRCRVRRHPGHPATRCARATPRPQR